MCPARSPLPRDPRRCDFGEKESVEISSLCPCNEAPAASAAREATATNTTEIMNFLLPTVRPCPTTKASSFF